MRNVVAVVRVIKLLDKEYQILCNAVKKANLALLDVIKNGYEKSFKENHDPVTTADLIVNTILQEELLTAFPDSGWLSEETKDNPERLTKKKVWIVDPVDGTKEFIENIPEYSISVALVYDGEPVLGAIMNPLKDELFTAIKDKGAFLNGKRIIVKSTINNKPVIVASRSENKRGEWEYFKKIAKIIPTGSIAYKLALVASGRADATFSLSPKNEWDICAGKLVLEEAGGVVTDKHGHGIIFNQAETLVNSIVGTSKVASDRIFEIINSFEE